MLLTLGWAGRCLFSWPWLCHLSLTGGAGLPSLLLNLPALSSSPFIWLQLVNPTLGPVYFLHLRLQFDDHYPECYLTLHHSTEGKRQVVPAVSPHDIWKFVFSQWKVKATLCSKCLSSFWMQGAEIVIWRLGLMARSVWYGWTCGRPLMVWAPTF